MGDSFRSFQMDNSRRQLPIMLCRFDSLTPLPRPPLLGSCAGLLFTIETEMAAAQLALIPVSCVVRRKPREDLHAAWLSLLPSLSPTVAHFVSHVASCPYQTRKYVLSALLTRSAPHNQIAYVDGRKVGLIDNDAVEQDAALKDVLKECIEQSSFQQLLGPANLVLRRLRHRSWLLKKLVNQQAEYDAATTTHLDLISLTFNVFQLGCARPLGSCAPN